MLNRVIQEVFQTHSDTICRNNSGYHETKTFSSAGILELRTYRLKPGVRDAFHRLLVDETLPLVRASGIKVVRSEPSLHDDDSYILIRAFDSLERRVEQEEAFYSSELWLTKYDAKVMDMIESYITAVIDVDMETIHRLSL